MKKLDKIFVSETAYYSPEKYDIVYSNSTFVKLLLSEGATFENLHDDAVMVYCLDIYEKEIKQGNFSNFVIKTKWNTKINHYIFEGLKKLEAYEHLIYFKQMQERVENLGKENIKRLITSDGLGVNDLRDKIDDLEFFMIEQELDELTSKFLKNHPNLNHLPFNKIYLEIEKFLGYKFTNY